MQYVKRCTQIRKASFYLAFFIGLCCVLIVSQPISDDIYFAEKSRQMHLFSFLRMYYETWSGRLVSNALSFLLLDGYYWLWRVLNAGAMMLLAWSLARLCNEQVSLSGFFLSICLLFLLPSLFLYEIFLWATGSIFYLWPLAAAAFLLVPFADRAFRDMGGKQLWPLRIVAALFAGCGNEQVALCTLGFMSFFFVFQGYRRNRPSWQQLMLFTVVLVGCIAMLTAPGFPLRVARETEVRFPEFPTLSFAQHVGIGSQWIFDRLFSRLTLLVLLSYGVALYRQWHKLPLAQGEHRSIWLYFAAAQLVIATSSLLIREERYQVFFTISPLTGSMLNKLMLGFPIVFWVGFSVSWALLLYRARPISLLCLFAAVCTLLMMCFSPTMYASGYRTGATAGVLLVFIVQLLLEEGWLRRCLLFCLPMMALVNLGYLLISGFLSAR